MTAMGAPGLVAARRSTATPRLNLPMSRILTSRSPPRAATVWISSALTMVASFCACENAADGASTAANAIKPSVVIVTRCIAAPLSSQLVVQAFRPAPHQTRTSALRPRRRRQPQDLRRIDFEQLRELLFGEPVRAQHLRALGERVGLEHRVD